MNIGHRNPKSETRLVVEYALRTATREHPITAEQIATVSGIDITVVRKHIDNCAANDIAHNVRTPQDAAYAAGPKPDRPKAVDVAQQMPQPRQAWTHGTYTGEKPAAIRPGSMDAYGLPTLSNGERIERKRPFSNAGKPEQRV
jgi:hypothetical protein